MPEQSLLERVEQLEAHVAHILEHLVIIDGRCNLACLSKFDFNRPSRDGLKHEIDDTHE